MQRQLTLWRKTKTFIIFPEDRLYYMDETLTEWKQIHFKKVNYASVYNQIWAKTVYMNKNEVFFISGLDDKDTLPRPGCYKYKIKENSMSQIKDIKKARSAFGICAINQFIYCVGGSAGGGELLKSCERYDVINDNWEDMPELPIHLIALTAISVKNRFIYVVGGFSYFSSYSKDHQYLKLMYSMDTSERKL